MKNRSLSSTQSVLYIRVISLILLMILDGGIVWSEIRITSNFENGSLGSWQLKSNNEINLTHAPGSGGLWYYFCIDGVLNQTLSFVFENARKDYYGGANLPAVSYDQIHWYTIKNRTIQPHPTDPELVRFRFIHTFTRNRAWIAFSPPFTNSDLDRLISQIEKNPQVQIQTICETPLHRRRLPLIAITDPAIPATEKKTILLFAREDAFETAGSFLCSGMIRFLLSDDPFAAAVKQRSRFCWIPLFDCDGVDLGYALHPLPIAGESVFWTETWKENDYSFYEQRRLKAFLQQWKDRGGTIDLFIRFHSDVWMEDFTCPEYSSDRNRATQTALLGESIGKRFLPWYRVLERTLQESRLSKFIYDEFPNSVSASVQCDYRLPALSNPDWQLYKSTMDIESEGELWVRAIGEYLGLAPGDPPPFLHGAELYDYINPERRLVPVHCVYRDLQNRPPLYVQVVINDKPYALSKVNDQNTDYQNGVLYAGFIPLEQPENTHYFFTSNGTKTFRVPRTDSLPGPYLPVSENKKK